MITHQFKGKENSMSYQILTDEDVKRLAHMKSIIQTIEVAMKEKAEKA